MKPEKALADHNGDNVATYCSQPVREIFQTQAVYFDGLREPYPVIDNVSNTMLASAAAINPRQASTSSILSAASAPLQPRKHKNRGAYDVLPTPSAKRSISLHEPQKYVSSSLGQFGTLRRSRF